MVGLTKAELTAVVQAHAKPLLPPGVRPICRPVSDGARRVLEAMRDVGPADLVHGLDVDLPVRRRGVRVSTVHDLSVFDTPWAFSRYRATGERLIVSRSITGADELIAVSAFTAERIQHHFQRSATVVPLAPPNDPSPFDADAVRRVRQRFDLPSRFVLQVASIEPRKDVALLADVCNQLAIPLILVGGISDRSAVPTGARHLGYVEPEDLDPVVDAADLVAYISHYEGFGLPPLEAMVRSKPVVASAVGALPEVVGDGARLVAVGDRSALAEALRELWCDADQRAELAERGRREMGRLSWTATAEATLDVYRRLGVAA